MRSQVQGADFSVLIPHESRDFTVTEVLLSDLSVYQDTQFLLGSAPAQGNVLFLSIVAKSRDLTVIETHSPFADVHEWAEATMGADTGAQYITIADTEVAVVAFDSVGLYVFIDQRTLVAILVNDMEAQKTDTEQVITALVNGERIESA
jgi:hypothetical protein